MNKAIAIVIAVIVLIALGVGVIYPALAPKNTASMTVTFYDRDNNAVYSGTTSPGMFEWITAAFTNKEGSVIDHVTVTISYTITSSETFTKIGALKVYSDFSVISYARKITETADLKVQVNSLTEPQKFFPYAKMTDSYTVTYTMAQLIPNPDQPSYAKQDGWFLAFSLHLKVDGLSDSNKILTAECDASSEFSIGWKADVYDFSITGIISV